MTQKKSPSVHHHITLSAESSQLRRVSTIGKNLLNSNTSTYPHNMANFGPLMAEIGSVVWGTPANFNGFPRLDSITARYCSSGRQSNFAALNRGRHLYSAGRPWRWALAHILFFFCNFIKKKFAGVHQTKKPFSSVSGPKFTILWGHVEEVLLFNKFFSDCRYMPYLQRYSPTKLCDGAEMAIFVSCISSEPRAVHFRPAF